MPQTILKDKVGPETKKSDKTKVKCLCDCQIKSRQD